MEKLAKEEQAAVWQYLSTDFSLMGILKVYWPLLLPALMFTAYGIYTQDYLFVAIGFGVLFAFVFWFFYAGGKIANNLKSALNKYEQECRGLDG